MKDDVTFPHDEYEVVNNTLKRKSAVGRAQSFTSVSSIRGSAEKRSLDEKSKGSKNATYDLSELAKKNNLVPPSFDPMENHVTFPHDEYEVVNDTLKRKSARGNGKAFTSLGSIIESDIQRTSIEKSKGYSATNSDKNELAQNKNLQPDFDRVEDDTSFPHEDLEVMQETLRSTPETGQGQGLTSLGSVRGSLDKKTLTIKSKARGRAQSFTSMSSIRGSAEKRTLDGKK